MAEYIEFLNVQAALQGPIPDLIISEWQEVAAEHRASGEYAAATSFSKMFPYSGNPLSVAVANNSPYAQILEEGHAGFHLPSRIAWPTRTSKLSKKGRFYLRIPFRHGTPGKDEGGIGSGRSRTAMPREVYRAALQSFKAGRTPSFPVGRDPATNRMVFRGQMSRPYRALGVPNWFNRHGVQTGPPHSYTWKTGKFEGMKRVQQRSVGGGGGSTYMTWRTLTQDSQGFFIPAMAGFHFADKVIQRIKGPVSDIISAAIGQDVADILSLKVASGGAA